MFFSSFSAIIPCTLWFLPPFPPSPLPGEELRNSYCVTTWYSTASTGLLYLPRSMRFYTPAPCKYSTYLPCTTSSCTHCNRLHVSFLDFCCPLQPICTSSRIHFVKPSSSITVTYCCRPRISLDLAFILEQHCIAHAIAQASHYIHQLALCTYLLDLGHLGPPRTHTSHSALRLGVGVSASPHLPMVIVALETKQGP